MRLIIRGKDHLKTITENEVKLAYAWSAQKLLGKKMAHNITTTLIFKKNLKKNQGFAGECGPTNGTRLRKFTIVIDPKYRRDTILKILFHEMKHMEQYVHLKLEDKDGSLVRWKRSVIDEDEVSYNRLPYEIEAKAAETTLLVAYQEFLAQYNISF